jgi:hypothetical protein
MVPVPLASAAVVSLAIVGLAGHMPFGLIAGLVIGIAGYNSYSATSFAIRHSIASSASSSAATARIF